MYISDALSRAYLKGSEDVSQTEKEADVEVGMLMSNLPMSKQKMDEVKEAYKEDEEMIALTDMVLSGWSDNRYEAERLKDDWNYRERIAYTDGLLFKANRLIISRKMRQFMLGRIHGAHLSVDKCKLRGKDVLFWPRMGDDIEEYVHNCNTCKSYRHKQRKEPMLCYDIPSRPWRKLAATYFIMEGGIMFWLLITIQGLLM